MQILLPDDTYDIFPFVVIDGSGIRDGAGLLPGHKKALDKQRTYHSHSSSKSRDLNQETIMNMTKGLMVLAAVVALVATSVSSAALDTEALVCNMICRAMERDTPACRTACKNEDDYDMPADFTSEKFCGNMCSELGTPSDKCKQECVSENFE